MKKFSQFLKEATASQQAQRLGLTGNGHGDWYDRSTGEFVAKTVQGKLQFFNKRQRIPGKDPAQTPLEKNVSDPNFTDPELLQQQPQEQIPPEMLQQPVEDPNAVPVEDPNAVPPEEQAPPPSDLEIGYLPIPKTKGTLTIAFGRFNPPTIGHQKLLDTAAITAQQTEGDFIVVPARLQDKKKNPLDPDTKISYMRKMFPAYSENIVNDPQNNTIFDVLKKAHNDGYANVVIVGGADRVKEFDKLSNAYNGKLYEFETIQVVSSGQSDPDAEGARGMSGSKLRKAATEGDFNTFRKGLSPELSRKEAIQLFDLVRQSMGVQENYELWQIAPKLDRENLRENYLSKKIFRVGQLVENLNTGLRGKIIRRGTNHLICVTEDDIMFKSWIKDVTEAYTEKQNSNMYRLPGKPNTLVGTTGYLKYAVKQTPGSTLGKENLQTGGRAFLDLLNKNRKSSQKRSSNE